MTLVEAVIQRDRQRTDWCAEIGPTAVVRAERAPDLIRKVREELARGLGLRWTRSIIVEKAGAPKFFARAILRDGLFAHVGIGIVRGETAVRRDGETLFRGWPPADIDEDLPDGINPPDTRLVTVLSPDLFHRPYTEAIWRGLCAAALGLARITEALAVAGDVQEINKALDMRALIKEAQAQAAPPKPTRD